MTSVDNNSSTKYSCSCYVFHFYVCFNNSSFIYLLIFLLKEMHDQDGSGRVYIRHGRGFQLLGDYQKAIKYLEKHLKIAIEVGDLAGEGEVNGNLGNAQKSLGDSKSH